MSIIGSRVRVSLTVGRLEYTTLLVGGLAGLAAKHAGANEWVISVVWLLMALAVRRARNRGALDRLVGRWQKSPSPERNAPIDALQGAREFMNSPVEDKPLRQP